ncbi:hypothetical protein [Anabaena sp. CCY 9402-a]|uniref:hypothetical protein n=1 Tax=Anabaena sp. CCY 9402-a TaxID=3103867 RepID=UPI0039C6DE8A
MRNVLSGCLVFAGLMSAAPALAGEVLITRNFIFTCQNRCVVIEYRDGEPTQVTDSAGGTVRVQQRRPATHAK